MSTGLTWLVFTESSSVASPSVENNIVFNDYNEAKNFAYWYMRCYDSSVAVPYFKIFIYTTGPNDSGYYAWANFSASFTVFD